MELLEGWGAADGRWKQVIESAFARSLPVELDGGEAGRFAFTLMPQWAKARWTDGVLQPAKLYHLAHAGVLDLKAHIAKVFAIIARSYSSIYSESIRRNKAKGVRDGRLSTADMRWGLRR